MIHLENYEPVKVPCLGKKYHVVWAHNGVVGVCVKIIDNKVQLLTPKTKIPFKNLVNISDLRHLKDRSARIRNGKSEEEENKNGYDCSKSIWKKINK